MAKVTGVIFDMDGVIVDTERQLNEGWHWAAKQLGVEIPLWLTDSFKGATHKITEKMFNDYFQGKIDYWETRRIRDEYIDELRKKEGVPVKPGLFELLDYIRENGLKCAVATSTRREVAEDMLTSIGAMPYFNSVVYGDQVENGKPAPDIFLKAAEVIGTKPEESIVIEDSINGIKAGYAAGMRVVHIPDTIIISDDIRALTYKVCSQLDEVVDVIKEINVGD